MCEKRRVDDLRDILEMIEVNGTGVNESAS